MGLKISTNGKDLDGDIIYPSIVEHKDSGMLFIALRNHADSDRWFLGWQIGGVKIAKFSKDSFRNYSGKITLENIGDKPSEWEG